MTDWVEAVAGRAQVERHDAEPILRQFGIRPTPTLPSPRQIQLRRVSFAGVKDVDGRNDQFEFDWRVADGIWCVASESVNLVGKSSVLEIIRWALRGRVGDVQADVRRWLRSVMLTFAIDDRAYSIAFDVLDGSPSGTIASAEDEPTVLGAFDGPDEFASAAEAFFMEQLNLEPIPFWQNDPGSNDGGPQAHSWAAYADAMHIHDIAHVIGDQAMAGLPGKLLEIFVGLPWASTHAVARIAALQYKQRERDEARRSARMSANLSGETSQLIGEVQELERRLSELPDATGQLAERDLAVADVQSADAAWLAATTARSSAAEALRVATEGLREDRRRLKDAQETGALRQFFHGVDPVVCPHCAVPVTDERRESESSAGICAVCGQHSSASENSEELIAELNERVDASAQAVAAARRARDASTTDVREAETARATARAQVEALQSVAGALEQRRELELQLARNAAVLQERERLVALPTVAVDDITERVLEAAAAEALGRLTAEQEDLFGRVNDEVLRLGRAFGIENLELTRLNRAGQLRIRKGGAFTHFGGCSEGERLRLKIAVVTALVRVGAQLGVGRYPGLVLLDSPGAYETNEEDLATMLRELQTMSDELPELQVIVASAQADLLRQIIPAQRLRVAPPGEPLW